VAQLFSYLEAEIKDNPVYKKYRDDTSKWGNWLDNDADDGWPTWQMPSTMEDGKSSSYFLFWKIANGSPSAAINIRHAISCKTSTYVF